MAKNTLKKFEDTDVQFFVMKSYLMTVFEHDRKKPQYHIYFIKKNSNPESYQQGYMNLKVRSMNKKEVQYFLATNKENYHTALENEDGAIYNFNERPFDKSQCPTYLQFYLEL
jgi:hypothetical protein